VSAASAGLTCGFTTALLICYYPGVTLPERYRVV
jgi:hypothetical protein